MRKKHKGLPIVLVVLGVVLLAALLVLAMMDKPKAQKQAEIQERAARLEQERDTLMAKRDALQQNYLKQKEHPATEQILFLELDPKLYSEAFPLMEKAGAVGTLGLSPGNFPGDADRITWDQFDELQKAGWDYCLVCGSGEDFSDWDSDMTRRLEIAGLDKPATVYFEKAAFDVSLKEEILRCGYLTAVHHGENKLSLIGREATDDLWLPGAHPWNYEGVRIDIQETVRFQGDTCFTVTFSQGSDLFAKGAFSSMLEYVSIFLSDGSMVITGFDSAREIHGPTVIGDGLDEAQWEKEKAEMDEQIRSLNEQIQAIYAEWNGGKK